MRVVKSKAALLIVLVFSLLAFSSCSMFEGMEVVMTTPDNVVEGAEMVPVDLSVMPKSWVDALPKNADGTPISLVYVGKEDLVDLTRPYIPVLDTPEGFAQAATNVGLWETVFQGAMGVGKTFLPGLAALEGLGLLFFKRKRMHYANAAKAVIPSDGKVDVANALASFGKALGMAHSSANSKKAAETV